MENKLKPYEIIAARFKISGESAKYFLGNVQKSFKGQKPPQQLIIQFMEKKKFKSMPRPHEVATLMFQEGIWVHPLHAEPPVPIDEPDIHF